LFEFTVLFYVIALVALLIQLEYQYAFNNGQLPGTLDLGIGYASAGEVSPTESFPSGYGYYIQIEQLVFRENPCCREDAQGLGVFFSYYLHRLHLSYYRESVPSEDCCSDYFLQYPCPWNCNLPQGNCDFAATYRLGR
jgi:hypothetical protein